MDAEGRCPVGRNWINCRPIHLRPYPTIGQIFLGMRLLFALLYSIKFLDNQDLQLWYFHRSNYHHIRLHQYPSIVLGLQGKHHRHLPNHQSRSRGNHDDCFHMIHLLHLYIRLRKELLGCRHIRHHRNLPIGMGLREMHLQGL